MTTSLLAGLVLFAFGVQPPPAQASVLTADDLRVLTISVATAHKLNVKAFVATIENESDWDITQRGDYRNGTPTSFGLCQFHNPQKDWGMTVSQADDPYYCLERMAEAWDKGQARRWSGYVIYLKNGG